MLSISTRGRGLLQFRRDFSYFENYNRMRVNRITPEGRRPIGQIGVHTSSGDKENVPDRTNRRSACARFRDFMHTLYNWPRWEEVRLLPSGGETSCDVTCVMESDVSFIVVPSTPRKHRHE